MGANEELDRLATEAGSDQSTGGSASEYLRAGIAFAAKVGDGVELRLGSEIAEAARRTPDTTSSTRGDDWIRFEPRTWDDHARDRLEAWFRVAWRRAG